MKTPSLSRSSLFASAALAVVTISVFASAASLGPESVVLRYHEAIVQGNEAAIRDLVKQDQQNPFSWELRGMTVGYLRGQPDIRIERVIVQGREAIVDVQYDFGARGRATKPFILQRSGSMWRIDSEASQMRLRQTLGLE